MCERLSFFISHCLFLRITENRDGAGAYISHDGFLRLCTSGFIECTTTSNRAGGIRAVIRRVLSSRCCFMRTYSNHNDFTFSFELNENGNHFNSSTFLLCAPMLHGFACSAYSHGGSLSVDEYNYSNSMVGSRHTIVSCSSMGTSGLSRGNEVNNTLNCVITAQSDTSSSYGTVVEMCNYINNKMTNTDFICFIRLHFASVKMTDVLIAGNNHLVLGSVYIDGKYEYNNCHFCSNTFNPPSEGKECTETFNVPTPNGIYCMIWSERFTSEKVYISTFLHAILIECILS